MPKHVFEKAADPRQFDFNKPVSLGAYVLHSYDPDGKWYVWQRRDDWQRTSLGRFGKPGPKYPAYIDAGPPDKRVIAQINHQLDVVHDVAPEGMFTLAKQSKSSHGWFKDFPYGHPDPTLPALIFNLQHATFKNRDVRWALALLIDIKAVSMASYRGAATSRRSASRRPARTPTIYHDPAAGLAKALRARYRQAEDQAVRPDDRQADRRHAAADHGGPAPDRSEGDDRSFGMGWWKPDPQAAQELLEKAGFKKLGGAGTTPDGKPFTIRVMVEGESRPVMTRAGPMIAQQWRQFGIDAKTDTAQGTLLDTPQRPATSTP